MSKKKAKYEKLTHYVFAIDPGNKESGWIYAEQLGAPHGGLDLIAGGNDANSVVRSKIRKLVKEGRPFKLLIEMLKARGMPTANEELMTCVEIGRFVQVAARKAVPWGFVFRGDVKIEICGSVRAKDSHIRQALIDHFGGEDVAIGGKKCPKCKGKGWFGPGRPTCPECGGRQWKHPPGPLYEVKSHAWPALAIAVYWDKTGTSHKEAPVQGKKSKKPKKRKSKIVPGSSS